ncbi:hypothetical protein GCM10025868_02870 [Angustibacter aerolatus]|uniref:ABC-type glycine betaine transport system substrate-binding domain-containing protein n=1 Tax=Angustibacter aerolatus TaxID=1162965 RepID=A0ABQ6JDQ2_9ACTN|nr:substrate-binding domain-containing protein [Angustibacter aerolatus]GMA85037.1 hypothetical protein GCM10025868_02870 [Angustibacter aerolatus]
MTVDQTALGGVARHGQSPQRVVARRRRGVIAHGQAPLDPVAPPWPHRPLLALVAALVVGTAGWALASRRSDQPTAAGCDRPAVLRVVTSESLLVPLQRAAKGFAGTARARAACATVEVRYLAPTSAADVLALAASSGSDPGFDVWVPDSSTWARVASRRPEVDRLLPDVFPVLASSPTVMAVPEPMARAAGWDDDDPTLQQPAGGRPRPARLGSLRPRGLGRRPDVVDRRPDVDQRARHAGHPVRRAAGRHLLAGAGCVRGCSTCRGRCARWTRHPVRRSGRCATSRCPSRRPWRGRWPCRRRAARSTRSTARTRRSR